MIEYQFKVLSNKDESSIGAVNVCNRCIVQIEILKIVLLRIGVDFAEKKGKNYYFLVMISVKCISCRMTYN